MEKYDFSEQNAKEMADFLVPVLDFIPEKRPTARELLLHPWLNAGLPSCTVQNCSREEEAVIAGVGNIALGCSKPMTKDRSSPHTAATTINKSSGKESQSSSKLRAKDIKPRIKIK